MAVNLPCQCCRAQHIHRHSIYVPTRITTSSTSSWPLPIPLSVAFRPLCPGPYPYHSLWLSDLLILAPTRTALYHEYWYTVFYLLSLRRYKDYTKILAVWSVVRERSQCRSTPTIG